MTDQDQPRKCPECGHGDLVEITFTQGASGAQGEPIQTADSHQVESYSCGHEVMGPRLDRTSAGSEDLDAERRTSDETVEQP